MSRNLTLDILKIVLAFFVVGLHGSFLLDINPEIGYVLKQGVFRSAVPIFLIISGYYFHKMNSVEKELKFIGRLFFLYLIWFIIYIPFFYQKFDAPLCFNGFFNGNHHLWYIIHAVYALFILSLLKRCNARTQITIIALCAVIGLILQYNNSYDFFQVKELKDIVIYRSSLFFCLPFIYIGFAIHQFQIKAVHPSWIIVGLILVCVESYLNEIGAKGSFDILISLYFFCPVVFLWAIHSKKKTDLKFISQISVAIYLVHPYFQRENPLGYFVSDIYNQYTLLTLSSFGLSFCSSFILILLNKRLKYLL